jgi:hypothetical protein
MGGFSYNLLMDSTENTFIDTKPLTRTHCVLVSLGHRVCRQVRKNGTVSEAFTVIANPDRRDRWGAIPEEDWKLCDEAEEARTYGPHRTATYKTVRHHGYDMRNPSWMDSSHGYYEERVFTGWK